MQTTTFIKYEGYNLRYKTSKPEPKRNKPLVKNLIPNSHQTSSPINIETFKKLIASILKRYLVHASYESAIEPFFQKLIEIFDDILS